jgi:DNA-binding PadR family transcriptional regulator
MTDAELTLLSILAEEPRYGHDIQQIVDQRGLREWLTIGFSSIFYILNKLERQKMLTSRLMPSGRMPARKLYEITPAGQGILQTAIASLLQQPRSLGDGFELGLANLHVLKPEQVYHVMLRHRDELRNQLASVKLSWSRHQAEDDIASTVNVKALYTHSLAMMEAELTWLDAFIEDWAQQHPEVYQSVRDKQVEEAHPQATTMLGKRPPNDRAKMIQRLKRLRPQDLPTERIEPEDD